MINILEFDLKKIASTDRELIETLARLSNKLNGIALHYRGTEIQVVDEITKCKESIKKIHEMALVTVDLRSRIESIKKSTEIMSLIESNEALKEAFSKIALSASELEVINAIAKANLECIKITEENDNPIDKDIEIGTAIFYQLSRYVYLNIGNELELNIGTECLSGENAPLFISRLMELTGSTFGNVSTFLAGLFGALISKYKINQQDFYVNQVELLNHLETETFRQITSIIWNEYKLVDDLINAYSFFDSVSSLEARNSKKMSANELVLLQLRIGARAQLLPGILACLRGHTSDGKSYLRKALEYALFAVWIFETEGAAESWQNANKDAESYDNYMNKFKIMKMLDIEKYKTLQGYEKQLIERLIDYYETCCVQVHATVVSLAHYITIKRGDNESQLLFNYIDKDDDGLNRVRDFFWHIGCHWDVLSVFAFLMVRLHSNLTMDNWASASGASALRFFDTKDKWRDKLYPDGVPKDVARFWVRPKKPKKTKAKNSD